MNRIVFSLSIFLCIGLGCAKLNHNNDSLRKSVMEYITAVQNGDINKVYEYELPEFKSQNSLENYKAHDLLGFSDSIPSFDFRIKNIQYQDDTATILLEGHLIKPDSIIVDTLKALFIKRKWYIPTYSSDLNLEK